MLEVGSECNVSEPRILDTLTMRPAGAVRISGRSACVSATTEKKFVSKVCRRISGVTVLVAAYNEADAIADTLTSLAAQDYQGPLEVLVLNDGSKDDTVALANAALQKLRTPPNITIRLIESAFTGVGCGGR